MSRSLLHRKLLAGIALGLMLAGAVLGLDRLYPPDLTRYRATSTLVLAGDDSLLHVFATADGHWRLPVEARAVDPLYLRMLCAYEDRRFYRHPGIDPLALLRAAGQLAVHGHVVSGGSTLTMQVARLLEPHPRSVAGKLGEIVRALQLEAHFSKADILGMYLTLAPFGGNLDGIRAASLAYFGKEPQQLQPVEAALLVALPQSPTRRRPDRHPEQAGLARAKVLARLQGEVPELATADPASPLPATRRSFPAAAPHFSRHLAGQMDGQIIHSTIDAALQRRLEGQVAAELAGTDPHVNAALLVVDNRSHAILAAIGGRDLLGPGGYVDLTRAIRSPGSTLKPFIYGMAFDDLAIHPDTQIEDTALQFDGYAPHDFDHQHHGLVTVREALQQSLNIPAIEVMQRVGPGRFLSELGTTGARLKLPRHRSDPGLAIALGGIGIDLRDLTMLYTGLANGGQVAPLVERRFVPPQPATKLLSPLSTWYLSGILSAAPLPDGIVAPSLVGTGGAIAFKTGTSYGFRDAWALGYGGTHTVGVWLGRTEGTPRPGFYGRNTAAPLLFRVFEGLAETAPLQEAAIPSGALIVRGNNELPLALQKFKPKQRQAAPGGPHILYPPQAATIDLLPGQAGGWAPVRIAAEGGARPLHFFINDQPLAGGTAQAAWQPDGPGFARVTVVDAHDRTASAVFRLKQAD